MKFKEIIKKFTGMFKKQNIKESTPEKSNTEKYTKLNIDDIMRYLEEAENHKIHKNENEETETAFFGIYRGTNEDFNGWNWLEAVALQKKLTDYKTDKETMDKLNHIIEEKYFAKYLKYSKEYYTKKIIKMHLDYFPSRKTALTYFSIYTNSGNARAKKILIKSLKDMNIDTNYQDVFEPKNLESLSGTNPSRLNKRMLINMQDFYNYLIAKNPEKYSVYTKGWRNRLKKLA